MACFAFASLAIALSSTAVYAHGTVSSIVTDEVLLAWIAPSIVHEFLKVTPFTVTKATAPTSNLKIFQP
jgi:hypothetical protein